MVEGAHLRAMRSDAANYPIEIPQNIAGSNAHRGKAFSCHRTISRSISSGLIAVAMTFAIDLNDQPMAETGEVGCSSVGWELPTKSKAVGA